MDLSDPTRAVTATLDGPVLAVLAAAGRPLTAGQVAEQAVRGSEIGIRRSLARLVEQGIVLATLMGRNLVHELNRDHVAADVAVLLADLRPRLWDKFRSEFATWTVKPLYAAVFGSAARGDGDASSDIDVLLVRPSGPRGESRTDAGTEFGQWEAQLGALREHVKKWTGNHLQIVDLSSHEWRRPAPAGRSLLRRIRDEGLELVAEKRG